jgi:16S rRNA (cytosine967-C5)-methyltransferase
VEITKVSGHAYASGMVNAVLRRISEGASSILLDAAAAHPAWMLTRWKRQFGAEAVNSIVAYDQQAPPATVRLETEPDALTEALLPGSFLSRARQLPESSSTSTSFRIQDEGSQLIAELAGCGNRIGMRILDCCAAPGGKTAILAENNPQAEITACDISEARLNTMRRNFAHNPVTAKVQCVLADATALPFRDDFDLILCDAPCSGTGTLARNPEIKLRLAASDLLRQQQRQIAILRSAYHVLAPGGRLIYSTCSLEAEENAMVVQALLAAEPTARLLDMGKRLEAMQAEGSIHADGAQLLRESALLDGYLQTVPGLLPCDGFFAAILTR